MWLLPYLTGDLIRIRLKLKRQLDWWPQGILRVEPPLLSKEPLFQGKRIPLSDYHFTIEERQEGEIWEQDLPLQGGIAFGQPGDFEVFLDLQKVHGDKREYGGSLRLAHIEVVSRGPFLTRIALWGFGIIAAGIVAYLIAVFTRN